MVLGCILTQPDLLFQPQYPLSKFDFEVNIFHKTLFICIVQVAKSGAKDISEFEIENFVKNYPVQFEILQDNNFFDFISTVKELSAIENYDVYYNVVRKFGLLRDLQRQGYDISKYFNINGDETEERAKLDNYSIQDILNDIDLKTLKLRNKFDVKYVRDEMDAGEDTEGLLELFEETPAFGSMLQSPYLTTLFQGWCRGHLLLRSAPSGVGKALTNSTVIPMADGSWKQVGKIVVGDYLLDKNGKPTKVLGVFPQGERQVWQISFKDGRKVFCDAEHLWTVHNNLTKNLNSLCTISTQEMYQKIKSGSEYRYSVPLCSPIEYTEQKYYLPPYIMGLFLGDASFRVSESNHALSFSSPNDYLPTVIANTMNWTLKKSSVYNYNWVFYDQNNKLVHVEDVLLQCPELLNSYSYNKYIPKIYLKGNIQQRYELLQGLLDTDGHVSKTKGRVSFTTTSEQLKDDISLLCNSLGIIVSIAKDKRVDKYTNHNCWIIRIQASLEEKLKLFKYSPKLNRIIEESNYNKRRENRKYLPIADIKKLNITESMTCFLVDNPEHLFLANDYIVTHNTRLAIADLCTVGATQIWDETSQDFVDNLNYQGPSFFIHTEMNNREEVNPMFLAAISGVEYRLITNGLYTKDQRNRILKAGDILLNSHIKISDMPDFTNKSIERKIKEQVEGRGAAYGIFDYVQLQGAIAAEYKETTNMPIREDLVLKAVVTELKGMAEKYNVGLYSMTQVNDNWKQSDFPDESCLSGGRSQKNKIDAGSIVLPTKERNKEFKRIAPYLSKRGIGNAKPFPNIIEYIYKSRFGSYGDQKIKIWSYFDKGTFKRQDYFCTDAYDNFVNVSKSVLKTEEE